MIGDLLKRLALAIPTLFIMLTAILVLVRPTDYVAPPDGGAFAR